MTMFSFLTTSRVSFLLRELLRPIDRALNALSMYKVVSFSLMSLLLLSMLFGLTNTLSISAGGLLLSVVVLGSTCYMVNEVLARLRSVPTNSESWLITALILACILPPIDSLARAGLFALAATIAMVSKYVLVYRGSHVLNPAAVAAFMLSVTGLLPATWWIANPTMAPFVALVGVLILRKTRRFTMFGSFAVAALLTIAQASSMIDSFSLHIVLRDALLSWPLLFLGVIMLTEPATAPKVRQYQIIYAVLVGCVFSSQLEFGPVSATPQLALLLGNIFAFAVQPTVGVMARFVRSRQLAPGITELTFALPAEHSLRFAPGQYLEWTLKHHSPDIRGNRRTFSIVSSPTEPELRIAIKYLEKGSSFKKAMLAMKPNDRLRVAHAAGDFTLPRDLTQPLLFVAGGIGITPFMSMINYLIATKQSRDITLLYLASSQQDFVYREVLEGAAQYGVRVQCIVGRLDAETLCKAAPDIDKRLTYISGPEAMVRHYAVLARSLGAHVKTDEFTGY